ncbi:MAG: hypothetical protein MAG795_00737 [Candidatus Woesearchaeota archaeon]|nr:hypothetical protein [Candidatus Woesearchaeota archaeon]
MAVMSLVWGIFSSGTTKQLIITFLILLIGFIFARFSTKIIHALYRAIRGKESIKLHEEKEPLLKFIKYVIMSLTIISALVYLRVSIVEHLKLTYDLVPEILSVILVLVLGVTIIEFFIFILKSFFKSVGLDKYMDLYNLGHLLGVIIWIVKITLHLVLLEILLRMVGIDFTPFTTFLRIVLYASFILLVLFIFIGLKWFVENLFAGLFLRSIPFFKVGRSIKYKKFKGEIENITKAATTIKKGKKVLWIPNKLMTHAELEFEEKIPELKSLPKIKKYFVEQRPSYCGPASAEIILNIFGHKADQLKIGEMCKTKTGVGTHPKTLIKVLEKLTKNKVKGKWIDYNYILDLHREIKTWLDQGALVIIDYKKNFLFPKAKTAHYSVVVAVEGNELLVVDPSMHTGGVYYVNPKRVFKGMNTYSNLIQGKRGYIVLAPSGTNAFWRIENDLVYADLSIYKDLSKKLRNKLNKLINTTTNGTIFPKKVKKFLNTWEKKEKVNRVWKP